MTMNSDKNYVVTNGYYTETYEALTSEEAARYFARDFANLNPAAVETLQVTDPEGHVTEFSAEARIEVVVKHLKKAANGS